MRMNKSFIWKDYQKTEKTGSVFWGFFFFFTFLTFYIAMTVKYIRNTLWDDEARHERVYLCGRVVRSSPSGPVFCRNSLMWSSRPLACKQQHHECVDIMCSGVVRVGVFFFFAFGLGLVLFPVNTFLFTDRLVIEAQSGSDYLAGVC